MITTIDVEEDLRRGHTDNFVLLTFSTCVLRWSPARPSSGRKIDKTRRDPDAHGMPLHAGDAAAGT
jgi:hypothetical protein